MEKPSDGPRLAAGTRVHVLTVSDGVASGTRDDRSGAAIRARIAELGGTVTEAVVPDDIGRITAAIRAAADGHAIVLTTGGTGLTPRDVTPQATRSVIDIEVPGIAEAMRASGRSSTPLADLSRSMAGIVGRALVVNLPGSPNGALESLGAIEAVLAHAVETLAGPHDHDVARRDASVPYDRSKEDAR